MLPQPPKHIVSLTPYIPGKPIEELERELGISPIIKLASNENPLGMSPKALKAAEKAIHICPRYPDGSGFVLKLALSRALNVDMTSITLGNGSNDVLELIIRTFARPGDEIIFWQYAFAAYPLLVQAANAKAVVIPAPHWQQDLEAALKAISSQTRLILLANPNNPTGTYTPEARLLKCIQKVPPEVLIVVDEAYHEYQTEGDYQTALGWIDKHPNLIVTRTFSKAYGLAGLRVGYAVSHPRVADFLNRVRQPFNVNSVAQAAAIAALEDQAFVKKSVELNQKGMQQLIEGLNALGLDFIPSVGNFLTIDFKKPAMSIYEKLLKKGVIVRPLANYGMSNHLRVSIGTMEENAVFLKALN